MTRFEGEAPFIETKARAAGMVAGGAFYAGVIGMLELVVFPSTSTADPMLPVHLFYVMGMAASVYCGGSAALKIVEPHT